MGFAFLLAMPKPRITTICALTLLSLGLVGPSPFSSRPPRRHISSACGDATRPATPNNSSFSAFPSGLFSFVQNDAVREAAEAYSLFQRQIQFEAAFSGTNPFAAPSVFGFLVPQFPSYELPDLNRYQVSLAKPDTSSLMWSRLSADPQIGRAHV